MATRENTTLIVRRECIGDKPLEEVMLPLLLDSLRTLEDPAHLIPDDPSNKMSIEEINHVDQQGGTAHEQLDSS